MFVRRQHQTYTYSSQPCTVQQRYGRDRIKLFDIFNPLLFSGFMQRYANLMDDKRVAPCFPKRRILVQPQRQKSTYEPYRVVVPSRTNKVMFYLFI